MRAQRTGGYTLVEVMLVVAIVAVALAFFLPAFQNWIQRTRVEGFGRNLTLLIHQARSVAIRDSTRVVVTLDESNGEVFAFFDRTGATPGSPGDGIYSPVEGLPPGANDQRLAGRFLSAGVEFVAPKNEALVDGFTAAGGSRVAVFNPDGSVSECGAFRFGDRWGNYLEVRVEPAASARVALRKHIALGGSQSGWFTRDARPWEWYWGKSRKGQ